MKKFYLFFALAALATPWLHSQGDENVHGTIQEIKFRARSLEGNLLGDSTEETVEIYLPPGYDANGGARYPVLYVLHGFSTRSVLSDWTSVMQESMDTFQRQNAAKKMIVVIPNGRNGVSGSFWMNSKAGGNWEQLIASELPQYIDSHFRTIPNAASRVVAGHSMGGFAAIRMDMLHSDTFGAVYAMSPCCLDFDGDLTSANSEWLKVAHMRSVKDVSAAIQADDFWSSALAALALALSPDPQKRIFADLPYEEQNRQLVPVNAVIERWKAQMPANMVQQSRAQLLRLRGFAIDYGLEDPFSHIPAGSNRLALRLAESKIPFVFETYHGDHNEGIPPRILTKVLPFFAGKLQF